MPSDVDSRHNPDGGYLSEAPFAVFLCTVVIVFLAVFVNMHCNVLALSMGLSTRSNRPASITSGNAAVTELQFYRHL